MKLKKKIKRKIPITVRKVGDPVPKREGYKRITGMRIVFDVSAIKYIREFAKQHPEAKYDDVSIVMNGVEYNFTFKEFRLMLQNARP